MNPYTPPRLLRSPHAQTILANAGPRRARVRAFAADIIAASEDLIADAGEGVRLLLHHTPPRFGSSARVAVLIHGWEGSANSTYMLSVTQRLWHADYRVVRINLRDHGGSHHLNQGLFHSCRLNEAVGAVRWVQERYPDESLCLGGFSLGGNFSLRIAAMAPRAALRIERVVAVCPVLDPAQTMRALDSGLWVYRSYFIRRWRRSLQHKKTVFPDLYDFANLERFDTLHAMTDYFVRNYTEYPDLGTYLRGYAITGDRLAALEVPATILLAEDDPVIPIAGLDEIASPDCLDTEISRFGGHCGFVGGAGLSSWMDEYILARFGRDTSGITRGNRSRVA